MIQEKLMDQPFLVGRINKTHSLETKTEEAPCFGCYIFGVYECCAGRVRKQHRGCKVAQNKLAQMVHFGMAEQRQEINEQTGRGLRVGEFKVYENLFPKVQRDPLDSLGGFGKRSSEFVG